MWRMRLGDDGLVQRHRSDVGPLKTDSPLCGQEAQRRREPRPLDT